MAAEECKLHTDSWPVVCMRRLAALIDRSDLASKCIRCVLRHDTSYVALYVPWELLPRVSMAANLRRSLSGWTVGRHVRIVASITKTLASSQNR